MTDAHRKALTERQEGPVRELTPKQMEVAAYVALGRSYAEIARSTDPPMTERTARVHVSNIAQLLPSIPGVPAYRRVFLWMHAEVIEQVEHKKAA